MQKKTKKKPQKNIKTKQKRYTQKNDNIKNTVEYCKF